MPEDTRDSVDDDDDTIAADDGRDITDVIEHRVADLLEESVPSLLEPLPDSGEDRDSCPVCLSEFGKTLEVRVPDDRPFIVCYSGHQTCGDCAAELEARTILDCPLCRGRLTFQRILNRPLLSSTAGEERPSTSSSAAVETRRREFFELGAAATRLIRELKVREDALNDREAELNAANGRFAHDGYFTLRELSSGRNAPLEADPLCHVDGRFAADGYLTLRYGGGEDGESIAGEDDEPER